MFDNLNKTFKSRVAIGTCVIAFGVFIYKTHPFVGFTNDWKFLPKISWLKASMRSSDNDAIETGTNERGASETGTSETGTSETGTSETGPSETGPSETDTCERDASETGQTGAKSSQ